MKAYGSDLLSSYGEYGCSMTHLNLRTFPIEEVRQTPYDPTDYRNVLFVVPSLEVLGESLLDRFEDLSSSAKNTE